ncbi:Reticulocyte-binding protein 2 a [Phytophthora citrophthora]|uniref:Reticulocyte-binding protein 2 a n=1 Tax=Phytophthora citrophthora TaxID=4793 RepID=A0AAD9GSJ0_9STRA|nr:Reticulocyte-binding protein 2 a [Phytophthora citrophthora]
MSAEVSSNEAVSGNVESDGNYHVRLIHIWPPPTCSSLNNALNLSFYGLQLELRGNVKDQDDPQSPITLFNDGQTVSKTGIVRKPASAPLHFDINPASSPELLESLDAITGPFEVVVLNKEPIPADSSIDEETLATLQQMANVQVENTLLEINGERFLADRGATGADVYRRLYIVASRASLALPFELTMHRHNLAQASAKIVPFARRKDVQDAQVTRQAKLAAQEAALPVNIRRKKLFLSQQLDFEREHYLVAYVSGPLQELHNKIMGSCQWQVYEFDKALWYFHTLTVRLYAQHPLRSHPEARELIERVQQQVQEAVRRLQRKIRSYQRKKRLMAIFLAGIERREEEKRKEREFEEVVRRVQCRVQGNQRRKRFLAVLEAEKQRQKDLRRQQEEEQRLVEQREEERRLIEQREEERRLIEQREEEKRQFEVMKEEQQRLQQEVVGLNLQLQQLQICKANVTAQETQTSFREDSAIETMKKEEQQRLQQQLETLELELQAQKEMKRGIEIETQTSEDVDRLELKIPDKSIAESVTQTSSRGVRDEGVDTGEDLEWQRYLTLLRVSIKNKKKSPSKTRHTQTESEDTVRTPKSNGEWQEYSSWHRSNNNSHATLKSARQYDEFDIVSPPTRTFESFFAPDLMMPLRQPPPPFVENHWKHDSSYLPLKSSRKLIEIAPAHQPTMIQLNEYKEPRRPMRTIGNSVSISPTPNPTKLPYITRRPKKIVGSSSSC